MDPELGFALAFVVELVFACWLWRAIPRIAERYDSWGPYGERLLGQLYLGEPELLDYEVVIPDSRNLV
jgi:hypothetical protein